MRPVCAAAQRPPEADQKGRPPLHRSLIAATVAVVAAVPLLAASTGGAATSEPVTVESRTFGAAEIRAAARSVKDGLATDEAITAHVTEQARTGRLVDSRNVRSAALGSATLSWEAGSTVQEARLNRAISRDVRPELARGRKGEILELDFVAAEDDAAAGTPQAVGIVGAGMTSASFSGGQRLTSGCQTWTVSGSSVTGCYQKYKPTTDGSSTRDYYAYNRWATAVGKDEVLFDFNPVIVDIRSRPWVGYGSRIDGLTDYFPISGEQLCNEGTSVNVGVGSLALTIGLTNCADKNPIPNATTRTMGVIYDDGFIFGGPRSKGIDFEMEVFNEQGGAVPIFGDYNYGKFCSATLLNCTGTLGKNGW